MHKMETQHGKLSANQDKPGTVMGTRWNLRDGSDHQHVDTKKKKKKHISSF